MLGSPMAGPGSASGPSCARFGPALSAGREQGSTSPTLHRNLPLPGRAGFVLLRLHVRGGNLAANVSMMTIESGAETWPTVYTTRSKGFVCSSVTKLKTELLLVGWLGDEGKSRVENKH